MDIAFISCVKEKRIGKYKAKDLYTSDFFRKSFILYLVRKKKKTKKRATVTKVKSLNQAHWIGRFGNRMFQVAYGKMFEKDFGVEFRTISKWEGDVLFKNCKTKLIEDEKLRSDFISYGSSPHGQTFDGWNAIVDEYNKRTGDNMSFTFPCDIGSWSSPKTNLAMDCCCWDSEYIFKQYSKKDLKNLFEFSDEVKESDMYKRAEDLQGTYDVAHLRRDDTVFSEAQHNWNYPVISRDSYEKAFRMFDVDPSKVEWISDDFPSHPSMGWRYPTGQTNISEIFFDFFPHLIRKGISSRTPQSFPISGIAPLSILRKSSFIVKNIADNSAKYSK